MIRTAKKFSRAQSRCLPVRSFPRDPSADYHLRDMVLDELLRLGTSIAYTIENDLALVEAYVTSAQAARMLAPLGRHAIGKFWPLSGNMVVISAPVTLRQSIKMLEAYRALN